jgi:3-phenylpropionate/trans-cinnamate dioxygenase ferredoxin reductase component
LADRSVDFLLIGGGIAAARCAERLRAEGADGSILLVGRELDPPYSRPPLSKGYLAGEQSREDAFALDASWWDENDVELLTRTSAMKLDLEAREVRLSSKEDVGFGKALIATGANVQRLRAEGSDLDGIHYLRAFANADAIRSEASEVESVVLIGGSYIASEVAATLTSQGRRCTMVMQEQITCERVYGQEVGGFFHRVLESKGVKIVRADELDRFEGSDERVTKVITKAGREIDCGLVVMGTGVVPDVTLAKGAGLELGESGGVRCTSRLETSAEGVYAAGDMAEYESPIHGRHLRIEHWDVAAEHGKTAALNMLGRDAPHETIPYFFSDLADWASSEYVGPGSGEPVVRGSMDDGDFTAFYLDDGRVSAALTVGRSDDLEHARRFIREKSVPDSAALLDPDTDLASL